MNLIVSIRWWRGCPQHHHRLRLGRPSRVLQDRLNVVLKLVKELCRVELGVVHVVSIRHQVIKIDRCLELGAGL